MQTPSIAYKADEHILTLEEAIEPFYNRMILECEARLVHAAALAGWPPTEALRTIERLRRRDIATDVAPEI